MICLDTNYLIRGLVEGTVESEKLIAWSEAGETLLVPMPVWYEFLCGPVSDYQVAVIRAFLTEIIPFGESQAVAGARLFNAVQRKRSLRVDTMIAATAITAGASLATNNVTDFQLFTEHGLRFA